MVFALVSPTAGLPAAHDPRCAKVESGGGGMPSFRGQLNAQQIADVAAFVSTRAGAPWEGPAREP